MMNFLVSDTCFSVPRHHKKTLMLKVIRGSVDNCLASICHSSHPCNLECLYTNFGWLKVETRRNEFMNLVRDVNALEYN